MAHFYANRCHTSNNSETYKEPLGKVNALVTVLGHLIRIAPCVADIQWIQVHIYELNEQIRKREEEELLKSETTDFVVNPNSRFKSIKFLSF